jgi:hypothetical protein
MRKLIIILFLIILSCKSISIVASKYKIENFICLKLTNEMGYIMYIEKQSDNYIYQVQVQQKSFNKNFTYYVKNFKESEIENCQ